MKVMFKIYDGSKYTSTETPKTCESEITGYEVLAMKKLRKWVLTGPMKTKNI